MNKTKLRSKLKALKIVKSMNNDELADYLGISSSTLRNWIMGRFSPNTADKQRLDALFNNYQISDKTYAGQLAEEVIEKLTRKMGKDEFKFNLPLIVEELKGWC